MKTANQYFAQILKVETSMKAVAGDEDAYYHKLNLLKQMLANLLIRDDLLTLNKRNLIHFISLCSSHRPREPHSILINISMAFDNLLAIEGKIPTFKKDK